MGVQTEEACDVRQLAPEGHHHPHAYHPTERECQALDDGARDRLYIPTVPPPFWLIVEICGENMDARESCLWQTYTD